MMKHHRSCWRMATLLLLLMPVAASHAIIIRHDKADSRYRVEASAYPQLFWLHKGFDNKICMASLVSPHWAITAAHCVRETPLLETLEQHKEFSLAIGSQTYRVDALVLHPLHDTGDQLENVDLALIRLDRDVPFTPVLLNRDTNEADQVLSLLGWGFTGIGTLGLQQNDGRFRRAQNRVDAVGQWLSFRFDDPRVAGNSALELEGIPSLGDSGGPALLETDQGLVLMGIALGELEEGESPPNQGLYGTVQLYERISSHLEWIEEIISD